MAGTSIGVLCVGLVVTLGACASGGGGRAASPATRATAAPTTVVAEDVAADHARAQAASLQLADVGAGWVARPSSSDPRMPGVDAAVATCVTATARDFTMKGPGDYASPHFADPSGGGGVASTVSYAATSSDAVARFAAHADPRMAPCLATVMGTYLTFSLGARRAPSTPSSAASPAAATVGTPSGAVLAVSPRGDQTVAYRLSVPVTTAGRSSAVYDDVIYVRQGRAEVQVVVQSEGTPPGAAIDGRYLDAVVGRLVGTATP